MVWCSALSFYQEFRQGMAFKEHCVVFRKSATEYIVLTSYGLSSIFCPLFRAREIVVSSGNRVCLFLSDNMNYIALFPFCIGPCNHKLNLVLNCSYIILGSWTPFNKFWFSFLPCNTWMVFFLTFSLWSRVHIQGHTAPWWSQDKYPYNHYPGQ